jgi:CO/xanthine dehydrogenase Mo-binding subunit
MLFKWRRRKSIMTAELQIIGKSEPRKDGWAKVMGAAQYTADIPLKDLCFGTLVRSPHHHARILRIDTSKARSVPEVVAVLTSLDVPGSKTFGPFVQDQPVLAIDEVHHQGEPVALVVAKSKAAARLAAECIQVEYEPLPAVFDPLEALRPGQPQVHSGGNLVSSYEVSSNDIATGFAQSDVILEEEFSVQRISPAYMEPENSLARWNPDDSLTIWVSSQKPFEDRKAIAEVLGLPIEKIQVIGAVIGGAFGGKEDSSIAILTALAAWAMHGSVQLANTRHESFTAHPKRHPARLRLKLGARQDGTLLALQAIVHIDTGAFASYGPAVGQLLTEVMPGPYHIPNTYVQTNVVYTHSPYAGAMRGFGSPQAHFAMESCMDMLAERLKIDPLELRRKNILQPGDRVSTQVMVDEGAHSLAHYLDAMQEARERFRKIPPTAGKVSGVGIALAIQTMGLGAKVPDVSNHRLEWLPDGKVLIHLGAPDLGQGLATVSEQVVAEALDLPFESVVTAPLDTLTTPDGGVTCASRMTYLVGNAMLLAANQIKKSLLEKAASMLRRPVRELAYNRGAVVLPDGKQYLASEFASRAADAGEPICVEAAAAFPYPEKTTPQHLPIGMPHVKFVYAGQIVRVEVDPELGTVEVKDILSLHDVGKVINRAALEGQIEGGVAMGIGYALYENVALKSNQRWVDSFTEYLLPTARDMPDHVEIQVLEIPEESGPYGAKGVAEISLVPTAPAIANAVFDAVKIRVNDLPITAEKLIRLM